MTVSGFLRLLTPFALKGSIVRGCRRSIFEISAAPSETRLATHSRDPIHDLSGQVFVGTWQHLPAASHSELARVLSTLSRSPFPPFDHLPPSHSNRLLFYSSFFASLRSSEHRGPCLSIFSNLSLVSCLCALFFGLLQTTRRSSTWNFRESQCKRTFVRGHVYANI